MTKLKQGPISTNELMQNLVKSKKIMNKVDTGDYQKGNINMDMITESPDVLMTQDNPTPARNITRPVNSGVVDEQKIRESKLPDAIKKAMIEHPIPHEISLSDGLDLSLVKNMMVQEGVQTTNKKVIPFSQQQKSSLSSVQAMNPGLTTEALITAITPIIESTIRKILDEKLTQILNAQQAMSINENLAIKVGNSVFQGKLTKVKNID